MSAVEASSFYLLLYQLPGGLLLLTIRARLFQQLYRVTYRVSIIAFLKVTVRNSLFWQVFLWVFHTVTF